MKEPYYKHVIFDLDGTLTDSQEGILNALVHSLNSLGINPGAKEKLVNYIGIPLQELFRVHFSVSGARLEEAVNHFRAYYREKGVYENKLYDGITDLLDALFSRSLLYVATAKLESNAILILEHFNIKRYFKGVAGADAAGTNAGKTYLVKKLLSTYPIETGNATVMVGDKSMDIRAAHDCQIQSVGAAYGYGSGEEIREAAPSFIANNVKELSEILLR
ncbi:MAG: HAD hydrolase-like protein [Bacteroidales bacterium]|nr:HAD hydrolase-like protein [Bacteroidales bacterium]